MRSWYFAPLLLASCSCSCFLLLALPWSVCRLFGQVGGQRGLSLLTENQSRVGPFTRKSATQQPTPHQPVPACSSMTVQQSALPPTPPRGLQAGTKLADLLISHRHLAHMHGGRVKRQGFPGTGLRHQLTLPAHPGSRYVDSATPRVGPRILSGGQQSPPECAHTPTPYRPILRRATRSTHSSQLASARAPRLRPRTPNPLDTGLHIISKSRTEKMLYIFSSRSAIRPSEPGPHGTRATAQKPRTPWAWRCEHSKVRTQMPFARTKAA